MIFVIFDVTFSLIALCVLVFVCLFRIVPMKYLIWFGFGALISSVWEITHALIPNFIFFKRPTPLLLKWFSVFAHIIWDSFILLSCAFLVLLLKIKLSSICSLLIMIAFGFGQEIIVELICNGKIWIYNPNKKGNPVLFTIGKVKYTLMPLLEWFLAPILFWSLLHLKV